MTKTGHQLLRDEKRWPVFKEKNRVTPSVTAPSYTNSTDATDEELYWSSR